MFDDIQQLEQEVAAFRSHVLEATELLQRLEQLEAALTAQTAGVGTCVEKTEAMGKKLTTKLTAVQKASDQAAQQVSAELAALREHTEAGVNYLRNENLRQLETSTDRLRTELQEADRTRQSHHAEQLKTIRAAQSALTKEVQTLSGGIDLCVDRLEKLDLSASLAELKAAVSKKLTLLTILAALSLLLSVAGLLI